MFHAIMGREAKEQRMNWPSKGQNPFVLEKAFTDIALRQEEKRLSEPHWKNLAGMKSLGYLWGIRNQAFTGMFKPHRKDPYNRGGKTQL